MSNTNTRGEKLKIIFATHPNQNDVFMASDDRAFFTEHQADSYGQGLKDREVKKYSRLAVEVIERVLVKKAAKDQETDLEKVDEVDASTDSAGSDETASDTVDEPLSPDEERAALAAKYEELLGKKPAWNMKLDKMKAAIAEAEAAD